MYFDNTTCLVSTFLATLFPTNIYSFGVNNGNTRTTCEICSKLTIKTPEWRQRRRSGVFIANFEKILHRYLLKLGTS